MLVKNKKSAGRRFEFNFRVFSLWLFGDVAFTVLPIAVIAIMDGGLGRSFSGFFLIPEWSFAAIVLYGLSIRCLVRLKTRYQKDFSYKLDTGIQILVFALIASVICLSLIRLSERNTVLTEESVLTFLQMGLFILGLTSLLIVTAFTEQFIEERNILPNGLSKGRYLRHLEDSLDSAIKGLNYFLYALEKSSSVNMESDSEVLNSRTWNEEAHEKLEIKLLKLERSIAEARQSYGICQIYSGHSKKDTGNNDKQQK